MRLIWLALMIGMVCWVCGCSKPPERNAGLSEQDRAAVIGKTLAYRDAWLANDSVAVMATIAPDAVLIPSGTEPIFGEAAIRHFWWPADGPATRVIAMDLVVDEVSGTGDLAVVRGSGTLSFEMKVNGVDVLRTSRSTFLNVLRRQPDRSWLITQRMWSDLK